MATQQYDVRVQNKRDTEVNWATVNPVLLDGEMILVETENGEVCTKYGDGVTPYADLPLHRSVDSLAITGAPGDFVVIGDDGQVTTTKISRAEEASF